MMTQGDENPYGSTKMSGTFLNVLEAVKYMDVFYNPLGDAIYQSRISNYAAFLLVVNADIRYGIISVEDNQLGQKRLHYMACAEVSSVCNLPNGMASMRLAKQDYAEFKHTGKVDVEDFNQTISYIYSNWLLQSNKKHTYAPDVEIYGSEFESQSPDSIVYYAIPIAPIS